MPRTVTVDEIIKMGPCYSLAQVERLFAGRASVSPAEVAEAAAVPARDRAWLLLRLAPREVWMPAVFRAAERAIRNASWALYKRGMLDASERLANLPPIVDTASARRAYAAAYAAYAYAAAYAAANAAYAAANAAYDAAYAAYAYAAAYAAYDAAYDAAYAANATAAAAAEWELFLYDVARLIEAA